MTLMSRSVAFPLWAVGAALLVVGCAIGGVVAVALTGGSSPVAVRTTTAAPSPDSPRPTLSATAPTPTAAPVTVTQATTTAPPPPAPTTSAPPPAPRGFLGFSMVGGRYGQSSAHSQCSNWTLRFINNSNTEITRITWPVGPGNYVDTGRYNSKTNSFPTVEAAQAPPAILTVSIAPYQQQDLSFRTCTSTPLPARQGFEFSASKPSSYGWQWVTGDTGSANGG